MGTNDTDIKRSDIKKIALAYSGGLDTSIIIPWLKERYPGVDVVAVCAHVGQSDDLSGLEARAAESGAVKLILRDVRREFVEDYLFPMLRAGAIYEGKYLLGTSAARPLQAKVQVEAARAEGADALAHGCTGKGNDQVRFELAYRALAPDLAIIAPWRLWDIRSREDAIDYAESRGIDLAGISRVNIYSRDDNVWHMSHEGGDLEDASLRPQEALFQRSVSPKEAPDQEQEVTVEFARGIPVALDDVRYSSVELVQRLNKLGASHGIGRADIVETRVVGMKSRGVYETPGGTILYAALRELEMLTLEPDALRAKQQLALSYADAVYAGHWFSTLRESLDAFMQRVSARVTGAVTLTLYKGGISVASRRSPYSLYDEGLASFSAGSYDHQDASGFIQLYGLSTHTAAMVTGREP